MSPSQKLLLLYKCLFVLALCTSNAQADSAALIDTGYQSGLISLSDDTAGITVGWEFSPTSDIWVTQLGYFDLAQDGLNVQHEIGIWDVNQELLVSATVESGSVGSLTGDYRYVSIPPTLLSAGQALIIGATVPVSMSEPGFESDFYPNNTVHINPINIALDSRISPVIANRYAQGNTTDMLELDFPDGYMPIRNFTDPLGGQEVTVEYYFFAPNFVFSELNPEPTTLTLLVMGGTVALARLSRKQRSSRKTS